jgi:hypothetical protein
MAGCGGIAHTGGKMLRSAHTAADVDRIVALGDPIVRNLQITQCYHELASALATMTGPTANWCTFATWASKQAGQTIRREDLARTFENTMAKSPEVSEIKDYVMASARRVGSPRDATGIRELVEHAVWPAAAFERASDAVSNGYKKVFEEIGREFARFIATCREDAALMPRRSSSSAVR